jgi:hypothetical protein
MGEVPARAVGIETKAGALRLPLSLHKLLLRLLRALCFGSARFARLERSKFLHQAALATGGIVFVNNAFFSSFIKRADGAQDRFLCLGGPFRECSASLVDGSASGAAYVAVVQAALLVLTISFDL